MNWESRSLEGSISLSMKRELTLRFSSNYYRNVARELLSRGWLFVKRRGTAAAWTRCGGASRSPS
jgi:hypothetical protein